MKKSGTKAEGQTGIIPMGNPGDLKVLQLTAGATSGSNVPAGEQQTTPVRDKLVPRVQRGADKSVLDKAREAFDNAYAAARRNWRHPWQHHAHGLKGVWYEHLDAEWFPDDLWTRGVDDFRSAELGMSMTMLLAATARSYTPFFATGELGERIKLPDSTPGSDHRILPIADLKQKIEHIIQWRQGQSDLQSRLKFFLPWQDLSARALTGPTKKAEFFDAFAQFSDELKAAKIDLVPVDTLREAVRKAGVDLDALSNNVQNANRRRKFRRRVMAPCAGVALALLALTFFKWDWIERNWLHGGPVVVELGFRSETQTPALNRSPHTRINYRAKQTFAPLCGAGDGRPLSMVAGEILHIQSSYLPDPPQPYIYPAIVWVPTKGASGNRITLFRYAEKRESETADASDTGANAEPSGKWIGHAISSAPDLYEDNLIILFAVRQERFLQHYEDLIADLNRTHIDDRLSDGTDVVKLDLTAIQNNLMRELPGGAQARLIATVSPDVIARRGCKLF